MVGSTEALIDPTAETASGLCFPYVLSCNNLLALDQGLIVQRTGRLASAAMQRTDAAFKTALGMRQ